MPVKISDLKDSVLKKVALRMTKTRRLGRILNSISCIQTNNNSSKILDSKKRIKKFKEREARLEKINPSSHTIRPQAFKQKDNAVNNIDVVKQDLSTFGLERKLSNLNNLLSIEFLEHGREASRAIVRISTPLGVGTGFFISPNIIITNNHVIESFTVGERSQFDIFAEQTTTTPNFEENSLFFSPSTFFYTDQNLDITLIAVEEEPSCDECGWLPLIKETGKILIGHPVNVVQHPNGEDKKIVLHNSGLLDLEDKAGKDNFCWYSADTEEGSSGAAVFNNRWEVIALHHKSVPKTNINGEILDINGKVMTKNRLENNPHMVKWIANEGVRISKIVANVANAHFETQVQTDLRNTLLALWENPKSFRHGFKQGWF